MKGKVSAFPFSVYSVNRFRKQEKSECIPEKRRSDIALYLTKNFNIIISFTNECAAAHLLEKDWRQLDGYTACYCEPYCFGCSGVYGLARKESSKGSVLLRMWRLRKELQAEDALSRPKEYIILGDTLGYPISQCVALCRRDFGENANALQQRSVAGHFCCVTRRLLRPFSS